MVYLHSKLLYVSCSFAETNTESRPCLVRTDRCIVILRSCRLASDSELLGETFGGPLEAGSEILIDLGEHSCEIGSCQ